MNKNVEHRTRNYHCVVEVVSKPNGKSEIEVLALKQA